MNRQAKQMQTKSRNHEVTQLAPLTYEVLSGTSGRPYRVILDGNSATCTCDWGKYRPSRDRSTGCSHVIAVFQYRAQQEQRVAYAWHEEEQALRQHKKVQTIGDGILITTSMRG